VARFRASLRDATGALARRPGVETPGYGQRSLRDPENAVEKTNPPLLAFDRTPSPDAEKRNPKIALELGHPI